jgi:hypothetical protein
MGDQPVVVVLGRADRGGGAWCIRLQNDSGRRLTHPATRVAFVLLHTEDAVKPRITLITLGVENLDRSVQFYRNLGLKTNGVVGTEFEYGAVAFFDLDSGLRLALWPRKSLAHDSGLAIGRPSDTDFCLAHNVSSKAEVDAVMAEAQSAGAKIVKAAQDTFWGGYAGYFQDPDHHLWEVAWNPQMLP